MERTELPRSSSEPNFIGAWMIEPSTICDDLIAYFDANSHLRLEGRVGNQVNLEAKNSMDLSIKPKDLLLPQNEVFARYFDLLFGCYQDYQVQWPFLKVFAEELHIGTFNIQRYKRGQHFQKVHTERSGLSSLHRLFAWMTYLNDVSAEDGGATVFTHYDLTIQPKKGLTLIWPAEWTHAHKGSVLRANSKHIVTGWMHFPF